MWFNNTGEDQPFLGSLHRLTHLKHNHAVHNCSACKTDLSKNSSYCCIACAVTTAMRHRLGTLSPLQHPTTVKQHWQQWETRPPSTSCGGIHPKTLMCTGKATRAPYFCSCYVTKLHIFLLIAFLQNSLETLFLLSIRWTLWLSCCYSWSHLKA